MDMPSLKKKTAVLEYFENHTTKETQKKFKIGSVSIFRWRKELKYSKIKLGRINQEFILNKQWDEFSDFELGKILHDFHINKRQILKELNGGKHKT